MTYEHGDYPLKLTGKIMGSSNIEQCPTIMGRVHNIRNNGIQWSNGDRPPMEESPKEVRGTSQPKAEGLRCAPTVLVDDAGPGPLPKWSEHKHGIKAKDVSIRNNATLQNPALKISAPARDQHPV